MKGQAWGGQKRGVERLPFICPTLSLRAVYREHPCILGRSDLFSSLFDQVAGCHICSQTFVKYVQTYRQTDGNSSTQSNKTCYKTFRSGCIHSFFVHPTRRTVYLHPTRWIVYSHPTRWIVYPLPLTPPHPPKGGRGKPLPVFWGVGGWGRVGGRGYTIHRVGCK